MRISTSPGFSKWLLTVKNSYPFSDLRVTRQGFNCKYVIVKEKDGLTINEQYFCRPTILTPISLIEELMYQGGCKPVPPDMTGIIDFMMDGGLQRSDDWYSIVLYTLWEILDGQRPCEREDLFVECIYWWVKERITESFDLDSTNGQTIMQCWHNFYWHWYHYDNNMPFSILFLKCEDFVNECLEDIDSFGGMQFHLIRFLEEC